MRKMMEIDTKKDAGKLVVYLLYTAMGQIEYGDYIDIEEVAYLLGAAKTIARMYGLKEYIEVIKSVDNIKVVLREATEKSMILLNRI